MNKTKYFKKSYMTVSLFENFGIGIAVGEWGFQIVILFIYFGWISND